MKRLCLTLAVLVGTVAIFASSAFAYPVSAIKYSPNPVYDDEPGLVVSFKTSRAARPGWEWGVTMYITGKYTLGYCDSIAHSWEFKRLPSGDPTGHRTGKGVQAFLLRTGDGYWCSGRASLMVVEHRIGSKELGKWVGPQFGFRVLHA